MAKNRKTNTITDLSIEKVNLFKEYKFILVIENNFSFGSVTEKLIDSLTCLSVPIYFGSIEIKRLLPDLFNNGVIDGSSYNLDILIKLVKNMSEHEYQQRLATIKKYREKYFKYFSFEGEFEFIYEFISSSL